MEIAGCFWEFLRVWEVNNSIENPCEIVDNLGECGRQLEGLQGGLVADLGECGRQLE